MFGQHTVHFGFTWTYVSYGKTTIRCRSIRCYTIFIVDIMYKNTALTTFCQNVKWYNIVTVTWSWKPREYKVWKITTEAKETPTHISQFTMWLSVLSIWSIWSWFIGQIDRAQRSHYWNRKFGLDSPTSSQFV